MCQIAGIEQRLSTAYHPETDGATERVNQEVLAYLRAFISFAQTEWSSMLPSAQLAINNRDCSSKGLSPFFLEHGYHVEPIQMTAPKDQNIKSQPAKRAERFMNRLKEAQEYAAAAMATSQQLMEDHANRSRNPAPAFRVGDKVWLSLKNIQTPQPKKKACMGQFKVQDNKSSITSCYGIRCPLRNPSEIPCTAPTKSKR